MVCPPALGLALALAEPSRAVACRWRVTDAPGGPSAPIALGLPSLTADR